MNILVLTSTYPKFEGDPTAPFIELLVRHTASLGHEMHVVVPEHRDWDRPRVEDGVHYHPFRYSPRRSWTPWGYAQSLHEGVRMHRSLFALAPAVAASAVWTCRAVMRRSPIALVHAHWLVPNGTIGAFAVAGAGRPLVVTVHGSDVMVAARSRWLRPIAEWTLGRASCVTAVSRYMQSQVAALGAPSEKLELIPLGADLGAFHPDAEVARRLRAQLEIGADELMVLGIGRLIAWKGFDYLIDAHHIVRASDRRVRLVIAGDGDLRPALVARVDRLGLRESVTFVGPVERDEVPAYYAAADIVAVPSIRHEAGFVEGLGYVALEALASGTPVVASNVGGLAEVVHDGETGLLVADRSSEELGRAILTLVRDAELRDRLARNALKLGGVAPSWNDVARQWEATYERLVERSRRPGSS